MIESAVGGRAHRLVTVTVTVTATDARLALPALAGWLTAVVLVGVPGVGSGIAVGVGLGAAAVAALAVVAVAAMRAAAVTTAASTAALTTVLTTVAAAVARGRAREVLAASIPSVVAVAVVALAVALAAPARTPPVLSATLESGGSVFAVLELEQTVTPSTGQAWGSSTDALIVAVQGEQPGVGSPGSGQPATVAVRVPVRLLGLKVDQRLPLGSRLEGRVRLIALEAGDDRVALVTPITPLEPVGEPAALIGSADGLRAGFLALMAPFAGDGADLLPGLAIGDTSAVSDSLDAAMKDSALSHLTAVSGANCAIVVGLVLGLGALARWPRPVRVGAALAALAGFVVLVTPEPSVVRAAVMAAAVLLALASGRPARGLPVLGLAVLGIIVLDPWIARQYGFVLSVLATAALLVLAAPLAAVLRRALPAPIALAIAVPLAAQLACQPVLILLAPQLPLAGVVANMLAAPAAPVATIVGMVACLLAPIIPPLATIVAGIAWLPSAWIAGVARVTSELPGALLPWPEGALGALMLAVLTAAGLVAAGVPARLGSPRWRRGTATCVAGALVVIMAATAGVAALRSLGRPADWVVAQCDIGQGDAVLVRDNGRIALIDTGANPELLERCLSTLGIDRIDLLVLTHFDLDHVGAVEVVVGRVDRAIIGPTGRDQDVAVVNALVSGGADVDVVSDGEVGMVGGCGWRVLWPPAHRGVEPGNDASLVVEWRGSGQAGSCPSMLTLGDLGEKAQLMLDSAYDVQPVDIVKVSHHGSADQHLELYRAVKAPVALIGVGVDNGYGHPAPSLLAELEELGAVIGRSDLHGLVLIGRDDHGLRVWRERDSAVGAEN